MKNKGLIDEGFNISFSTDRIKDFEKLFTPVGVLQNFVTQIHEEDNTLDLKRGEFYPEILRCIMTLKEVLAESYDLHHVQCQPNFGSNGSIDTILTAVGLGLLDGDNHNVLVSTPTYFRNYNSALSRGLTLEKIPLLRGSWEIDINTFLEKLKQCPSIAILVSPNNPTGVSIKHRDLVTILENTHKDTLVLIDKTLADINDELDTKKILKNFSHKNIVILHSLSKYLGLSHLRIGFALYSNEETAKKIQPLLPLGLGVEGVIKALKNLKDNKILKPSKEVINNIIINKEKLSHFCKINPQYRITDFTGNYCLFFLPQEYSIREFVTKLKKGGVYVMGGNEFPEPMENAIRMHTGGDPKIMDKFVEIINEL